MNRCSVFEILSQLNFIQYIVAVSLVSVRSFSLYKKSHYSNPKGLLGRSGLICSTCGNWLVKLKLSVNDIDTMHTGLCECGLWVIVRTVMLCDCILHWQFCAIV